MSLPHSYEESELLPTYDDIISRNFSPTYYTIKKCKHFFSRKEYYRVKILVKNLIIVNVERSCMHNSRFLRVDYFDAPSLFVPIPADVNNSKVFNRSRNGEWLEVELKIADKENVPIALAESNNTMYAVGITFVHIL